MTQIIVVNGYPEAGKDTFVNFCKEYIGEKSASFSTVDFIKDIYTILGWNGQKTAEARKWLSDCKDFFSQDDVLWHYFSNKIDELSLIKDYIFVFSREPQEIQKFVDYFDATTVLLMRPGHQYEEYSNHADSEVTNFRYDHIVLNKGNLEDLGWQAVDFCHNVLGCK